MKKEAVNLSDNIQWTSESLTHLLEKWRPVLTPINQVAKSTREVGVGQNQQCIFFLKKTRVEERCSNIIW